MPPHFVTMSMDDEFFDIIPGRGNTSGLIHVPTWGSCFTAGRSYNTEPKKGMIRPDSAWAGVP